MRILNTEVPMPETPQAKFWAWTIGIVTATTAILIGLDTTFARRADAEAMRIEWKVDVAQLNTAQTLQLNTLQMDIQFATDQTAKRAIDTELFRLEQVPPQMLRPQDRALYQKLVRDRQEMVDLWNRRGRPLR